LRFSREMAGRKTKAAEHCQVCVETIECWKARRDLPDLRIEYECSTLDKEHTYVIDDVVRE
jgi:hypothetical protein